jgi:acyl phosphate:glycerol-3-phosphate acyltransferase
MIFFSILLAYLIGSIPFALIIGKLFYNTDVRQFGSGNLGATNTFRTLGKKAGIFTMIGDIGKGILAASLPFILNADVHPLLTGIFAIIGHSYPLFANFRGGKSVATTAGVIIAFSPMTFIVSLFFFLISLKTTKYVSLSSVLSGLTIFICSIFLGEHYFILFSAIILIFITYKHRMNFIRIKNGSEPKVKWI